MKPSNFYRKRESFHRCTLADLLLQHFPEEPSVSKGLSDHAAWCYHAKTPLAHKVPTNWPKGNQLWQQVSISLFPVMGRTTCGSSTNTCVHLGQSGRRTGKRPRRGRVGPVKFMEGIISSGRLCTQHFLPLKWNWNPLSRNCTPLSCSHCKLNQTLGQLAQAACQGNRLEIQQTHSTPSKYLIYLKNLYS